MTSSLIVAALDRTIEAATFKFESFTTDGLSDGISNTTRGYCDLVGPIIAAELTVDIRMEGFENLIRTLTFTSGKTLYQVASEEADEWVALESHGVGSTALSTLYWLYGTQEATPAESAGRYGVMLSFPLVFRAAPAAEVDTLREGIRETRPDLLNATARGHVNIADDGLIHTVELELPRYDGPDPSVSQPAMLVTLSLTPTARRSVEFPEASERMTLEKYKNLMLYGDDHLS